MAEAKNPYPKIMVDEASGVEVSDIRHRVWAEGYAAGRQRGPVVDKTDK